MLLESSERAGSGWPTPKPTHQDDSCQESLSFLVRQCYLVLSDILQTFIRSIALKFTFPVKPIQLDKWDIDRLNRIKNSNGLFRLLEAGYSWHVPIYISPDDVANNICCIWSKYVFLNAEKLRSFFVQHDGKKKLTYYSTGRYHPDRMPEFMDGLTCLISADQDNDNLSWMDYSSSISMPTDRLIRTVAKLASQKAYYEYQCVLCCGFSQVELGGTLEDWERLWKLVEDMPTPDDFLTIWRAKLLQTITGMLSGEEDFWQRCLTTERYGSGGQTKRTGWILNFNPINDAGEVLALIEDKDILDLTVDFDLNVDDNGNVFDLNISAGPTRVGAGDYLAVQNTFQVKQINV